MSADPFSPADAQVIIMVGAGHRSALEAMAMRERMPSFVIALHASKPPPAMVLERQRLDMDAVYSKLTYSPAAGETDAERGKRIAQERRRAIHGPRRGRY